MKLVRRVVPFVSIALAMFREVYDRLALEPEPQLAE